MYNSTAQWFQSITTLRNIFWVCTKRHALLETLLVAMDPTLNNSAILFLWLVCMSIRVCVCMFTCVGICFSSLFFEAGSLTKPEGHTFRLEWLAREPLRWTSLLLTLLKCTGSMCVLWICTRDLMLAHNELNEWFPNPHLKWGDAIVCFFEMGSRWPQTYYTYTSEPSASSGILNPLKHDAKVEMTGFHLRGREMNEQWSIYTTSAWQFRNPQPSSNPMESCGWTVIREDHFL